MILSRQAKAGAREKGDKNGKQKAEEKEQMSPPAHQLKGPVVVNGKTAPKGKTSAKGQTKGQVKCLMVQSKEKAYESLSDTSVPTPLPVQFMVCHCQLGPA